MQSIRAWYAVPIVALSILGATGTTVAAIAGPPEEVPVKMPTRVVISAVYLARVEKVVNGDTLIVRPEGKDGEKSTLHLFAVRAPKAGEPLAKEATEFLKKNVEGKRVRVEARRRDEKGVTEARVTLLPPPPPRAPLHLEPSGIRPDMPRGTEGSASSALMPPENDRNLNYMLVRAGLARRDATEAQTDKDIDTALTQAEASARQDKVGQWAETSTSTPPANNNKP
jgi:endonuclease YncB( thermonuclease family)